MENFNQNTNIPKKRHGIVTVWLVFMIIANSFTAIINLFSSDLITTHIPGHVSTTVTVFLGILGIINVIFSILILNWKKIGFWGFVATGIASVIIHLSIGLSIWQSAFGLLGIAISYGVLQIKKDNVTAWQNLE